MRLWVHAHQEHWPKPWPSIMAMPTEVIAAWEVLDQEYYATQPLEPTGGVAPGDTATAAASAAQPFPPGGHP